MASSPDQYTLLFHQWHVLGRGMHDGTIGRSMPKIHGRRRQTHLLATPQLHLIIFGKVDIDH